MQDTVRASAFTYNRGKKVDTRIQWNTMMYETYVAHQKIEGAGMVPDRPKQAAGQPEGGSVYNPFHAG